MCQRLLNFFVIVILSLITRQVYSQSTPPQFIFSSICGVVSTTNSTQVNQVIPASGGGYYVAGSFSGTVSFGSYTLTTTTSSNVFVARVDVAGNYQWAAQSGANTYSVGNSLAVDGTGNVYISGYFRNQQATFGSITLTQSGLGINKTFVAKLSPTGTWLWATQTGGGPYSFGDEAVSLVADAASNIYIAGQFVSQKLVLGTTTLTNSDLSLAYNQQGQPDIYIAKLSSAGTWLWAVNGGGTNRDLAAGLALDPIGNLYLAGSYESTTAKFGTTTLANSGYTNAIVAKLDAAGNWLWAVRGGGGAYCYPYSIAVDASGQAYITGEFTTSTTFGGNTVASAGYYDVFVAKLGATGTWQWVNQCGSTLRDMAYSVAVDSQGNAYIGGSFRSATMDVGNFSLRNTSTGGPNSANYDLFVAKLDMQGNWQWATQAAGSGSEYASSVAVDALGQIWLAGYINGPSALFGATSIPTNPGANIYGGFVARLASQVLATQQQTIASQGFTLYPNPSRSTVWISGIASGQSVHLYDMAGRLLMTGTAPNNRVLQWNLSSMPPGVYLVRSGSQAQRLVID